MSSIKLRQNIYSKRIISKGKTQTGRTFGASISDLCARNANLAGGL